MMTSLLKRYLCQKICEEILLLFLFAIVQYWYLYRPAFTYRLRGLSASFVAISQHSPPPPLFLGC